MRTELAAFRKDERGSILFIFGLGLICLTLFVGLAIDMARVYSVSQRVQAALDAAALEAAKLMSQDHSNVTLAQSRAVTTFNANMGQEAPFRAQLAQLRVIPNAGSQQVSVDVSVRVPTIFARVGGFSEFRFDKGARTSYAETFLEVVLALDVTGSMSSIPAGDTRTKIEAMKAAATGLVNQLYDGATSDYNVRISVVPWSSGVKAGSYLQAMTGSSSGADCLVERAGSGATSDSMPNGSSYAQPMPSAALAIGYVCPNSEVQPLRGRQHRNQVVGQVNGLTTAGGTAGHIGTAWAWYMVSPNMAAIHQPEFRPQPRSRNVIKTVIVMTDGAYNSSFVGGTVPAGSGADPNSYAMFQAICQGMRDQGIRVYTVAFDLNDAAAVGELGQCATSSAALTAANSGELAAVFSEMASDLQSLRLTN